MLAQDFRGHCHTSMETNEDIEDTCIKGTTTNTNQECKRGNHFITKTLTLLFYYGHDHDDTKDAPTVPHGVLCWGYHKYIIKYPTAPLESRQLLRGYKHFTLEEAADPTTIPLKIRKRTGRLYDQGHSHCTAKNAVKDTTEDTVSAATEDSTTLLKLC